MNPKPLHSDQGPETKDREAPHLSRLAFACVLAYATLAGLHTLSDFDVWWQLASGRYWIQTGHLARQDVFSYTAAGAPWVYPAVSGLIFYLLFRLGGYTLLSLLTPLAAAGVALLLLRKGGLLRAWTVLLAVPAIVWRTNVRADLFTTVLAAVFVALLWEHASSPPEDDKVPLWLLPVLMLAWVNLHPGFVLGLGLIVLFLARSPRTLAPWAGLTLLATLLNPWGWRVYAAVLEQAKALSYQNAFIGEWISSPLSWQAASEAFRLRDPEGSYWLLLGVTAIAVGVALWRRRFFGALLLVAMAAASLRYYRFQALFAVTACVVVPDVFDELRPRWQALKESRRRVVAATATAVLTLLVLVRVADLVSGRYYLLQGDLATFGVGQSPWFPERALRFVEEHKLPREIYNDYNLGGYLTWRAWPGYRVFIDGRALPFGADLFFLQKRLSGLAPDSAEWQQTLNRWPIHTFIVSTARSSGYGGLHPKLFCDSDRFRLVYLDEAAAVFVESGFTSLPALDCRTVKLPPPALKAPITERFRLFVSAGTIYYVLDRRAEAEEAFEHALQIFEDDPWPHQMLGLLRLTEGRTEEAERELRRTVDLSPTSASWNALGNFMMGRQRYREAEKCFREAVARRSEQTHESYFSLGKSYLSLKEPRRALEAFNQALDSNPYRGPAESMGREFEVRAFSGRAYAWLALRDLRSAVADLEYAVSLAPSDINLHIALAHTLLMASRLLEARRALTRAQELGATGPDVERLDEAIRQASPSGSF